MKTAGILLLIISSTGTGLLLVDIASRKVKICGELIKLCDMLSIDIGYKNTPVNKLIKDCSFSQLDFITSEALKGKAKINSPLSDAENNELSAFLISLGTTDIESRKKLICGFREYCVNMYEKYSLSYSRNSKLYICFGIFGGAVVSMIII